MSNINCLMIQSNNSKQLALLSVDGRKGSLSIVQTASQARTDVASVLVKLEGEKAFKQKINSKVELEGLKEYLSEFYINAEYVQSWSI